MRRVVIDGCPHGAIMAKDLMSDRGDLLLAKGAKLSERRLDALLDKGYTSVTIDDPDTDGIEIPDVVSESVKAATKAKLAGTFDMFADISGGFLGAPPEKIQSELESDEFLKKAAQIDPLERLREEVEAMMDEIMTAETLDGLNAIMIHDDYTFQHSVDVAIVSTMIAKQIGMPRDRLSQITLGGLLHDVGKVFIPLEVLNKPGKLTDKEFDIIKSHPTLGYQLLRSTNAGDNLLAHHVVYQHHERQDGKGYPRGLTGRNQIRRSRQATVDPKRIHIVGEISGVADTYEALAADRPYRLAFPPEKVREILWDMSGEHLNHEILMKAMEIIPRFPSGSEVEMVTGPYAGFWGIVAKVDKAHLENPVVRLLENRAGERISPIEIDLLAFDYEMQSARRAIPEKMAAVAG